MPAARFQSPLTVIVLLGAVKVPEVIVTGPLTSTVALVAVRTPPEKVVEAITKDREPVEISKVPAATQRPAVRVSSAPEVKVPPEPLIFKLS